MKLFNFLFVMTCVVEFALANRGFLLTPKTKSGAAKMKISRSKVKKVSKIETSEFLHAVNLTKTELDELSKNFIVEQNFVATADWHLDRIDQHYLPLSFTQYEESSSDNSNVDIYIVDTGVDISHPEFVDNTPVWGGNFVGDNVNSDCNGHGTHVASLALGKVHGVAKRANLFVVKVLDCNGSGSYSGIISSIEWITNHAKTRQKKAIVNMSLGGPASFALDTAIANSISTGVQYVVAAGNSNANACNYSPARVRGAITVAASNKNDYKASFSNYGKCVDLYAPGVQLRAAWPGNTYASLSGTSMASPVVAGALAVYLSKNPVSGYTYFLRNMTNGVILRNPRGTLNKLVYV